jgi:hypothetical protein
MIPKEVKKFIGKVVKMEILDHATYDRVKDSTKEGPFVLVTYGIIKIVAKDKHDRWFLNINYDFSYDNEGKISDESGSTYLLSDILSILELHE